MESAEMERLQAREELLEEELAAIDLEVQQLQGLLESDEIESEEGFDHVIILDNLPKVTSEKVKKLEAVLKKIVTTLCGDSLAPNGIHLAMDDEAQKTLGFAFLEFKSNPLALVALTHLDNYRMDKTHVLRASPFNAIEEISSVPDEFVAPDPGSMGPPEYLRSWLLDPRPFDQYCLNHGETTEIYWNEPHRHPDPIYARKNWTDAFVGWSPFGTFMTTIHPQGVQIWGGEKWKNIHRFPHSGVKMYQFSPQEGFIVTCSPQMKEKDNPRDPQCIIVWDARTGKKGRGFVSENDQWPEFSWSHDDQYFARISKDAISIYESKTFGLLHKKSVKVPNIQDFCWSPSDNVISYFVPESGNSPARVTLISVPSLKEIATKSLFNVAGCRMHWQESGNFLCVKVDRLSKTKKKAYVNFEVFRMREKNVPVEVMESQDTILAFAWEPVGSRFAFLHASHPNQRPDLSICVMEEGKIRTLKTFEKRQANSLFWSPQGGHLVLAGLRSSDGGRVEFVNANDLEVMGTEDHFGCSHVAWDPTGRFLCTYVAQQQMENGYNIWSFRGKLIHKVIKDRFYQFVWRPRPPSLLSKERKEYIEAHLKEYSARIAKEEVEEKQKVMRELEEKRERTISEFRKWFESTKVNYDLSRAQRRDIWGGEASDEDSGWEEVDEIVEELISEDVVDVLL